MVDCVILLVDSMLLLLAKHRFKMKQLIKLWQFVASQIMKRIKEQINLPCSIKAFAQCANTSSSFGNHCVLVTTIIIMDKVNTNCAVRQLKQTLRT